MGVEPIRLESQAAILPLGGTSCSFTALSGLQSPAPASSIRSVLRRCMAAVSRLLEQLLPS